MDVFLDSDSTILSLLIINLILSWLPNISIIGLGIELENNLSFSIINSSFKFFSRVYVSLKNLVFSSNLFHKLYYLYYLFQVQLIYDNKKNNIIRIDSYSNILYNT
jgi:hypothetical protein